MAAHSRPLRAQLAFTYAGIALLTAVLLGGILLGVLGGYYARSESNYLNAGSRRVLEEGLPAINAPKAELDVWVLRAAIAAQARVKLYAADGRMLADSGSLGDLDPSLLSEAQTEHRGPGREGLPRPLGGGLFENATGPTSSRTLRVDPGVGQGYGGYLLLSEAPASGTDALRAVTEAWMLAAALAVALAAVAGYLLSSRISKPLVELTRASDRMAQGDLSTRAPRSMMCFLLR